MVRIEEMILAAEENEEHIDLNELSQIIHRLDNQSGPYGTKRKQLVQNLFKSILEMSLPGFIEYLFYGYEQRESESGFFNAENYENTASVGDQKAGGSADQRMNEDASESHNE